MASAALASSHPTKTLSAPPPWRWRRWCVDEQLHLYPNSGLDLRRVLAEKYETKIENVIAGSGSEGIISNIIRTFLGDEDEVLTTEAAFIGFQVLAKSRGVAYRTVPYRDWHYDLAALAGAINDRTKIIYLANPNNPTGTIFSKHEFDEFYRHVPERVLIILDEAYFEYAKDTPRYPGFDALSLRQRHHAADVFENLRARRSSHRLWLRARAADHQPAQGEAPVRAQHAGAGSRHRARSPTRSSCTSRSRLNARGMKFLTEGLREIGLTIVPSEANFVMVVLPDAEQATRLTTDLLTQGIIIRPLASFGLPNCVRISTGTDEDNQRCVEAIQKLQVPLAPRRLVSLGNGLFPSCFLRRSPQLVSPFSSAARIGFNAATLTSPLYCLPLM